jgi:hypothetical protein
VTLTLPSFVTGGAPTTAQTRGVHVAAGSSVTFPVGLYSDGSTVGPWSLSVVSGSPFGQSRLDSQNVSHVQASIDLSQGQNGEKAYVTVDATSHGSLFGGEIVTVVSTQGSTVHYMPIWISGM